MLLFTWRTLLGLFISTSLLVAILSSAWPTLFVSSVKRVSFWLCLSFCSSLVSSRCTASAKSILLCGLKFVNLQFVFVFIVRRVRSAAANNEISLLVFITCWMPRSLLALWWVSRWSSSDEGRQMGEPRKEGDDCAGIGFSLVSLPRNIYAFSSFLPGRCSPATFILGLKRKRRKNNK